jgi:hypothetical protein
VLAATVASLEFGIARHSQHDGGSSLLQRRACPPGEKACAPVHVFNPLGSAEKQSGPRFGGILGERGRGAINTVERGANVALVFTSRDELLDQVLIVLYSHSGLDSRDDE